MKKIFSRSCFVFILLIIFSFVFYNSSNAIDTTLVTDLTPLFGGQKLKTSSDNTAVLKVQFGSDSDGENLTSIKVTFAGTSGTPTWTSAAATSSELADLATTNGGIQLWKDAGAAGFQGQGTDTQVTLAANPLYN